jgi:hypothetical protein
MPAKEITMKENAPPNTPSPRRGKRTRNKMLSPSPRCSTVTRSSASAAAVNKDTFYDSIEEEEDDDQLFDAAEELNKDKNCESKRAKTEEQNESIPIPPQFDQTCFKHFRLSELVIATLVATTLLI